MHGFSVATAAALLTVLLVGCEEQQAAAPPAPIRAIKYMTLQSGTAQQERGIAGIVVAGTTSTAAFQTTGQVIELKKKVGDVVKAGEVLARLDPEPLRLRVSSARSEVARAQASVSDSQSKHRQQKQLFDKGFATRTNFESALASLRTSRGALGVAQSQLNIARRDLSKTVLKAPFSGVIAKRDGGAVRRDRQRQTGLHRADEGR
ncbi:MAG: efflux RND transporter periplasmic adaptor subunit [Alphaproteobacteria bacterium]